MIGRLARGSLRVVTPLASLGPILDTDRLYRSPWRRGRRLVDAAGKPVKASEIAERALVSAFPEGADPKDLAAPIVVVRIEPANLDLPEGRDDWAPDGLLDPAAIAESYWHLHRQPRSAWTLELDLRPWVEKF